MRKPSVYTREQIAKSIELMSTNQYTQTKVGFILGMTRDAVQHHYKRHCKNNAIPTHKPDREYIARLVLDKTMSLREVGKTVGMSLSSIRNFTKQYCKEHGIPSPFKPKSHACFKQENENLVNRAVVFHEKYVRLLKSKFRATPSDIEDYIQEFYIELSTKGLGVIEPKDEEALFVFKLYRCAYQCFYRTRYYEENRHTVLFEDESAMDVIINNNQYL